MRTDDVSRVARATRAIVRAEDAGRVAEVASVARGRDRRAIDASSGWTRERARAAGRGGRSGDGGDGGSGLRRRRTHRDGRGLQLDGLREGPLGRELDESRPDHARGILRDEGLGGDAGGELAIEGAREGRRATGVLTRSASTEKKPQRAKRKEAKGHERSRERPRRSDLAASRRDRAPRSAWWRRRSWLGETWWEVGSSRERGNL